MTPPDPSATAAQRLDNLMAALCLPDEDDEADAEIRIEAQAAGLDLAAWAAELRAKAEARAADERTARRRQTQRDRLEAAARLAARAPEPIRPRDEQLLLVRALLEQGGPQGVSVHFHKFEEATDEDLARLLGELRHLVEIGRGSST